MSITTTDRDAGPYTGTGLVSVYPFSFKVFQASDLLVVRTDTGGEQSTLALTTDYSATLNADQNASPGGYITLTSALASGYQLTITSNVPMTQPARLTNGGGFFPQTIEDALDRLTILFQQLGLVGSVQALRVPEIGGIPTFPAKSTRANRVAAFDADGNPTTIVGVDSGSAAALDLDLRNGALAANGAGQLGYNPALSYTAGLGKFLNYTFGRTAGEIAASVTPSNYAYPPGDVRRYGAIGNGVADDTAAIQSAMNTANGVAARVYFPSGTFKTTATLNWPSDWPLEIVGSGVDATIINYAGNSVAISMYDAGASTKFVKSSIRDLKIVGNGSTSTVGVNVRQAYMIAMESLRISGFQVGVRIEQTWNVKLIQVIADFNTQYGLELHNEANSITAQTCEFVGNTSGIYTAGARAALFSNCTIEANTQFGAYITANSADSQSENITFHGCYIEGNTTNDIRVILDSGAVNPQTVIVRDCYFVCMAGKATTAIRAYQVDHLVVDGCYFSTGTATYAYSLYISDGGTVSGVRWGKNRDASTSGVYRGTGTSYSDETRQEARAWGTFTLTGTSITSSSTFGVSNITRISTGVYEVTLRDAMPSANYAPVCTAENGASFVSLLCSPGQPISTTVFRITTASNSTTVAEARTVNFTVFA